MNVVRIVLFELFVVFIYRWEIYFCDETFRKLLGLVNKVDSREFVFEFFRKFLGCFFDKWRGCFNFFIIFFRVEKEVGGGVV